MGAFGRTGAELLTDGVSELGGGELIVLGVGEALALGVAVSLDDPDALGVGDSLVETEAPGVGEVVVGTGALGVADDDALVTVGVPVAALSPGMADAEVGTQSSPGGSVSPASSGSGAPWMLVSSDGDSSSTGSAGGEDGADVVTVGSAVPGDDGDAVTVGSVVDAAVAGTDVGAVAVADVGAVAVADVGAVAVADVGAVVADAELVGHCVAALRTNDSPPA